VLHKSNFLSHLKRNPCLYASWYRLKSELEKSGWVESRDGLKREFSFQPAVQEGRAVEGVHVFRSKAALTKYIHRFPLPLQSDETLSITLKSMGWSVIEAHSGKLSDACWSDNIIDSTCEMGYVSHFCMSRISSSLPFWLGKHLCMCVRTCGVILNASSVPWLSAVTS
jgi:hypothetical protein